MSSIGSSSKPSGSPSRSTPELLSVAIEALWLFSELGCSKTSVEASSSSGSKYIFSGLRASAMDPLCTVVALLLSGVAFRETGSNLVNDFEGLMEEGRLPRLYDELFIEIIYAGRK